MKNWKTTLFGVLGATSILLRRAKNPALKVAGVVMGVLGNLGLGTSAKDKDKT